MIGITENKRILVVEDDADLRDIIIEVLESNGYDVYAAECGEQARRMLHVHLPDLVVIDLGLPDVDGLEICTWMQGERALRRMPIVVISGRTNLSDRLRGFLKGAARYLCKPFELDHLVREVRGLAGPSTHPFN